MAADVRMSFRAFGAPGAPRLVVLVGVGAAIAIDPLPAVTATRAIRVVALGLKLAEIDDPGAYGGQTPAETTAQEVATLIRSELDDPRATAGMVAYRGGGDVACEPLPGSGRRSIGSRWLPFRARRRRSTRRNSAA